MIIDQLLRFLIDNLGQRFYEIIIADVRIGLHLTAVKLSDGSAGVATTLHGQQRHCYKSQRRFGEFSPLYIKGKKVSALLDGSTSHDAYDSLKMAALNALSAAWITGNKRYKVLENIDPVDLLKLDECKHIIMVGAFQSYIRKITAANTRLSVVELNNGALLPEQQHLYVPADDAQTVIRDADVVIITAMTLVNSTFDRLLQLVSDQQKVVVTGPSGSIVPEVLFANKVDILGATVVTDPDKLLQLAGEAGAGYHLFYYCAKKVSVVRSGILIG